MAAPPSWTTRLIVAAWVSCSSVAMFFACGFTFLYLLTVLGISVDPVVGLAVSFFLIAVVAPTFGFWAVRAWRSDARSVSWWLLVPVVIVHLLLYPPLAEVDMSLWFWPLVPFALSFVGALCGTFWQSALPFGRPKEPTGSRRTT